MSTISLRCKLCFMVIGLLLAMCPCSLHAATLTLNDVKMEVYFSPKGGAEENAAAQAKLTKSVVEQAQKLSMEINYATLLPLALGALVCVLAFGSLTMWAGYSMGAQQSFGVVQLLRMPSGFLMAGLCLAGGLFLAVYTGKEFSEGYKGWWKRGIVALIMLVVGGVISLFAL